MHFMKCLFSSALVVLFALAGCSPSTPSSPSGSNEKMRNDIAPIAKRLPKLGTLQSVSWTSTLLSKDSVLSPPVLDPTYRVRGFAQLEKAKANELSQQFEWERMQAVWKPELTITNLKLESAEWSQSTAFTKEYKPQQIPGKLFFERQKGVVYFDLEIE